MKTIKQRQFWDLINLASRDEDGFDSFMSVELINLDLSAVDMSGCSISGADFVDCDMRGTNFAGAVFVRCKFSCTFDASTNFDGSTFKECSFANPEDSDGLIRSAFDGCRFAKINFDHSFFERVRFERVALGGVLPFHSDFSGSCFEQCDFERNQCLYGECFNGAIFERCNLTDVNMSYSSLRGAHFVDCADDGLELGHADLTDSISTYGAINFHAFASVH